MPSNIEIKARVPDVHRVRLLAATLADAGPTDIPQDDTFFHCAGGRLKLRTFSDGTGQLIYYERGDGRGPKSSFYVSTFTDDPDGLRTLLTLAHGVVGRVRKHRVLYVSGRTRIHIDNVEGLGDFVELEVAVGEHGDPDDAVAEAHRLMSELGIDADELVSGSYLDLIVSQQDGD